MFIASFRVNYLYIRGKSGTAWDRWVRGSGDAGATGVIKLGRLKIAYI